MSLINGAQACNVYWQVGSSATLGTTTTFRGSILALTSIALQTGATIVEGRALARNGAVTLETNTITRDRCRTAAPAPTATPTPAPSVAAPVATPSPGLPDTSVGGLITASPDRTVSLALTGLLVLAGLSLTVVSRLRKG